jgi:hypothetical protein
VKSGEWNGGKSGGKLLCKIGVRLEHGAVACYFELLPPEWRNWQTRWTQNPVVLSTVWVRPPPPGPALFAGSNAEDLAQKPLEEFPQQKAWNIY